MKLNRLAGFSWAFAILSFGMASSSAVIVDVSGDQESAAAGEAVDVSNENSLNQYLEKLPGDIGPFPYWNHVGKVGMGTGIYLGDGYVLTSAHVGCFPFQMHDGTYYKPNYKTWRLLKSRSGAKSDLAVFQVDLAGEDSSLSKLNPLPISSVSPKADQPIIFIGAGLAQAKKPSTIRSNGKVLAVLGYHVDGRRDVTWGVNTLSKLPTEPIKTGSYETHCYVTQFDRSAFEAQAANGDSGGPSFVYNEARKRWELAGCIIGVSQKGFYVPIGSRTYLANLSQYRYQVESLNAKLSADDLAAYVPSPGSQENEPSKPLEANKESESATGAPKVFPAVIDGVFPD